MLTRLGLVPQFTCTRPSNSPLEVIVAESSYQATIPVAEGRSFPLVSNLTLKPDAILLVASLIRHQVCRTASRRVLPIRSLFTTIS